MKEAFFYKEIGANKVQCNLCPHNCMLDDGSTGSCKVRKNIGGILYSQNYGQITGFNNDPIEKKPLYHYYPGRNIFSIGSIGCNLHCQFCQNHEIAQCGLGETLTRELSPGSLVNDAMRVANNIGIAYTYNEPLVYYEFMRDTALLARQQNLKNVMVTNGFFEKKPLEKMLLYIDAFSVDLKAFTDSFYKKMTKSGIEPVKESLKRISRSQSFLEVTNLIIPGENDNVSTFKEMLKWYEGELGRDTVLHISRYYPRYKLAVPPTSVEKMEALYDIASEYLNYVYIGNLIIGKGSDTFCPKCGNKVIERTGYQTNIVSLNKDGACAKCNLSIIKDM